MHAAGTFLTGAPTCDAIAQARTYETGDDRWEVIGREMHIRYARGAGRPQMKDASIARALGVAGTARNLNTVRKPSSLRSSSYDPQAPVSVP
ncbi:hypothetical protein GOARA_027_00380 [Gordonia araii NBRC 100433]|uniref:Uncharacterized protein n=1 Tax=Gordonia araii NBRC 100433 TaxID=1073574 RepID=G7GZQ0_9ACTN|nr:hypothetical protein [Gordonia araii]GAB09075.1 hypothetical protein GOARA_027_00380 [Gordonia araii NBRC 100433]